MKLKGCSPIIYITSNEAFEFFFGSLKWCFENSCPRMFILFRDQRHDIIKQGIGLLTCFGIQSASIPSKN